MEKGWELESNLVSDSDFSDFETWNVLSWFPKSLQIFIEKRENQNLNW